jgi:hypothetical protein
MNAVVNVLCNVIVNVNVNGNVNVIGNVTGNVIVIVTGNVIVTVTVIVIVIVIVGSGRRFGRRVCNVDELWSVHGHGRDPESGGWGANGCCAGLVLVIGPGVVGGQGLHRERVRAVLPLLLDDATVLLSVHGRDRPHRKRMEEVRVCVHHRCVDALVDV